MDIIWKLLASAFLGFSIKLCSLFSDFDDVSSGCLNFLFSETADNVFVSFSREMFLFFQEWKIILIYSMILKLTGPSNHTEGRR